MHRRVFLLWMILVLGSAQPLMAQPDRVVVYYPDYRGMDKQTLMARPFERATHAIFSFLHFNARGEITYEGEVIVSGGKMRKKAEALRNFSAAVRAQGAVPMVSFGGAAGGKEFQALAPNEASRKQFAVNAMMLCANYRLGGIDLDWEHPHDAAEGAQFMALVQQVRAVFDRVKAKRRLMLTLAVTGTAWFGQHLPDGLMEAVDWYNIMDYDHIKRKQINGENPRVAGPHSSYSRAKITIDYWINQRGLPRDKAVLGVPFYGLQFIGADEPDQPYSKKEAWKYADIAAQIRSGAVKRVDVKSEGAVDAQYVYSPEHGGGVVFFNGPRLIARKAQLVADEGLGGIMAWELGQDASGPGALMGYMRGK